MSDCINQAGINNTDMDKQRDDKSNIICGDVMITPDEGPQTEMFSDCVNCMPRQAQ